MDYSSPIINEETFLVISQQTLVPGGIRCDACKEPGTEAIILACWEAYSVHLLMHSKTKTVKDRNARGGERRDWFCKLRNCNAPAQSYRSREALQAHMKTSHMPRQLHCPVKDCGTHCTRPNLLVKHFSNTHLDMYGLDYAECIDRFSPSWIPSRRANFPEPPPLPTSLPIATVLFTVTRGERKRTAANRAGQSQLSRADSASNALQLSPSPQKQRPSKERTKDRERDRELMFDDFEPSVPVPDDVARDDYMVWHRPVEMYKDVSRPPTFLSPDEIRAGPAPPSIHFEFFKTKVDLAVEEQVNDDEGHPSS